MRTTRLLAIAAPLPMALAALALAQPALAADAGAAAPSAHQGLAFTPSKTAKAHIVEPDGRVVLTDSVSDLVAPASIAERRAKTAITSLIRIVAAEKAAKPAQIAASAPAESRQVQEP